jgi:hypothetical protein
LEGFYTAMPLKVSAAVFRAALGVALAYGALPTRPFAVIGQEEDEQSYYKHAYSIVDLPLPEIMSALPELQGLQPAADQQELPDILTKVGEAVLHAYEDLRNVAADEEITEEQYGYNGRLLDTSRHHFGYLITVDKSPGEEVLHEYRTNAELKPVRPESTPQGFPFTTNSASMWVLFHPQNRYQTNFRYLGKQSVDGQDLYVIAFAELPGKAAVTGRINLQGRSALLLYQGVAWIHSKSFRIAKMRLDLLEPQLDVALERLTTEIQFGEVRIPQATAALWLPQAVTVTTVNGGQLFRNRHAYSNFRLFTVKSETKAADSEQAPPRR